MSNNFPTSDRYSFISHSDGSHHRVNPGMAKRQKLSEDDISDILALHVLRDAQESMMAALYQNYMYQDTIMNKNKVRHMLFDTYKAWLDTHGRLQDAWKFGRNPHFVPEFDAPGCSCPKMDNRDRMGTPYRVHTNDCVYHGSEGVHTQP